MPAFKSSTLSTEHPTVGAAVRTRRVGRDGIPRYRELCSKLGGGDDDPDVLPLAWSSVVARLADVSRGGQKESGRFAVLDTGSSKTSGALRADAVALLLPWLAGMGSELRRIVQAGTGHREPHARLWGIYRRCYAPGGCSDSLRTLAESFVRSGALSRSGEEEPAEDDVHEAVFLRLSLSCFPVALFPEIVGYALAEIDAAPIECERFGVGSGPVRSLGIELEARCRSLEAERSSFAAVLRSARLGMGVPEKRVFTARVGRGIALQRSLMAQVWRGFDAATEQAADTSRALRQLLLRKAPFGLGYHAHVMLDGRSLDDWFRDQPFRMDLFLAALENSPWVDRAFPDRSALLRSLSFDGPMFGVFTPEEESVLRAWLNGHRGPGAAAENAAPTRLARMAEGAEAGDTPKPSTETPSIRQHLPPARSTGSGWRSRRWLFHALLNIEQHALALPAARGCVEQGLRRVARDPWHRWGRFPYTEAAFEAWLCNTYRAQLEGTSAARERRRLSRSAYVFGIEQLAPSILVDGCWLQRAETLAEVSPLVARRLIATYGDEMGNGTVAHNHASLYRGLLESLDIECPPVESPAFAADPRFLDAAFDLPVLMLSISFHSHRFLPELLGLNLAIELSGLGDSYGRVARDMEYWGIDAHIVRLHQSIDNFASGHAALARETILLHLRQISGLGGDSAVQTHWRRIQTGYDLLRVVTRAFKWRLVIAYAARTVASRLMGRVGGGPLPV